MTDREFSRRVDFFVFKDEPSTLEGFAHRWGISGDELDREYQEYRDRWQPYRWHAKAKNGEIIARGESYHNVEDCLNAVNLLAGDDTTAYVMPTFGDDRSEKVLRFGATDRSSMEPPF